MHAASPPCLPSSYLWPGSLRRSFLLHLFLRIWWNPSVLLISEAFYSLNFAVQARWPNAAGKFNKDAGNHLQHAERCRQWECPSLVGNGLPGIFGPSGSKGPSLVQWTSKKKVIDLHLVVIPFLQAFYPWQSRRNRLHGPGGIPAAIGCSAGVSCESGRVLGSLLVGIWTSRQAVCLFHLLCPKVSCME